MSDCRVTTIPDDDMDRWRRQAAESDAAEIAAHGFTRPPSRTVLVHLLVRMRQEAFAECTFAEEVEGALHDVLAGYEESDRKLHNYLDGPIAQENQRILCELETALTTERAERLRNNEAVAGTLRDLEAELTTERHARAQAEAANDVFRRQLTNKEQGVRSLQSRAEAADAALLASERARENVTQALHAQVDGMNVELDSLRRQLNTLSSESARPEPTEPIRLESGRPCGCDPAANWTCEQHRG